MSSESALWQTTKRGLSPFGRLVRIESPLTEPGIPDVIYCLLGHSGWIELKQIDSWPKRDTTALKIPHLRLEQVLFLENWCRRHASGKAWGLFQIARDYLLLSPTSVRCIYERAVTRPEIIKNATVFESEKFPTQSIVKALTSP